MSSFTLNMTTFNSSNVDDKENADPISYVLHSMYTPLVGSMAYLLFVRKFGPAMMKNRQPFNINSLISMYNLVQVFFNFYLCLQCYDYLSHKMDTFFCILPETPGDAMYEPMRKLTKLFFINKSADLLDTVFFVLKKKNSHLTFLHLYHHMLTFLGSWFVGNYMAGGGLAIFGLINAFVHTVMYGYYFISSLPVNKNIIRLFRKPVTQLQLLQFAIVGLYGLRMMTQAGCVIPTVLRYLAYFGLSQILMMIVLFVNFYRKSYLQRSKLLIENNTQAKKIHSE